MTEPKFSLKGVDTFFDPNWFGHPASSTVFLRAYVSVGVPLAECANVYGSAIKEINLAVPVRITWIRLRNFPTWKNDLYYHVDEDGNLGLLMEPIDLELPNAVENKISNM